MVTKVRLLLQLCKSGASQREMSRQLDLSRTSIKNYLDRLHASGKSLSELEALDDSALLQLAQGAIYRQMPDARLALLQPLLPNLSIELSKRYTTVQILWEEYVKQFGDQAYSYTTFKHHLQEYVKAHTYSYHNTHIPADTLQVDFAGDSLYITDRYSGDKTAVVVLCCTLPCSGYSFIYALPDASMDNLFAGISKSLNYIGGVPHRILSDNMKQWVKRRDKDGPHFTDAALEFGLHYSTVIEATGVRKPKHKASVEGSVHFLYERIYVAVRDDVFFTIEELNARLMELLDEFNARKMKNREYSRVEYFELNEKEALQPLPDSLFTLKYTKECRVGSNYHIYVSTHQYSVPYDYVNQMVSIIYNQESVEIYDSSFARIAIHKRSFKRYGYTTIEEHMPPNHQAYEHHKNRRNASYYLYRAGLIDKSAERVIQMVLDRAVQVEQAYTSCEAILQLHRLDPLQFILACEYAVQHLSVVNYRILKQIMHNRVYLDKHKDSGDDQILHSNLRGKDAFLN